MKLLKEATVPYVVLTDENKIAKAKDSFIVISDVLHTHTLTTSELTKLYKRVEFDAYGDVLASNKIATHAQELFQAINDSVFDYWGEYSFKSEWDLKKFLKAFSFENDNINCNSILDNQIALFQILSDIKNKKAIIYCNLLKIIDENELKTLVENAKFYQFPLLFIESNYDGIMRNDIKHYVVDHDFCVLTNGI